MNHSEGGEPPGAAALGPLDAARMAHEFNNLLGLILSYAELAQRDGAGPHLALYLDEIATAAHRAVVLTRQLADLGSAPAARLPSDGVGDAG